MIKGVEKDVNPDQELDKVINKHSVILQTVSLDNIVGTIAAQWLRLYHNKTSYLSLYKDSLSEWLV